jgi:hypothetical protein
MHASPDGLTQQQSVESDIEFLKPFTKGGVVSEVLNVTNKKTATVEAITLRVIKMMVR